MRRGFRIKQAHQDVFVDREGAYIRLEASERRRGKKGEDWHHAVIRLSVAQAYELAKALRAISTPTPGESE